MSEPKQLFKNYLRKKNLKWSQQREFIVDLFLTTHKHITTEDLYQLAKRKVPQIGYSTIHRTLKLLSECGLASERHFSDRSARFEVRKEGTHHDHLICIRCGRIVEFECEDIENMQQDLAKKEGFIIERHKLELYGICKTCQKSRKKG